VSKTDVGLLSGGGGNWGLDVPKTVSPLFRYSHLYLFSWEGVDVQKGGLRDLGVFVGQKKTSP